MEKNTEGGKTSDMGEEEAKENKQKLFKTLQIIN